MNLRRVFLVSHRWFGIIAGLHFVLLGLSGSYLVYGDQFEKFFFKDRYYLDEARSDMLLKKAVANISVLLNINNHPVGVEFPSDKRESLRLTYNFSSPGKGREYVTVFYDPIKNRILDQVSFSSSLKGFLFKFHHDLFMGGTGRVVMGISGVLCMLLLLSGLWLWWPKKGRLKQALARWRRGSLLPFTLDAHKLIGFYTLALMILVTFTGLYISVPSWFGEGRSKRPQTLERAKMAAKGLNLEEVFLKAEDRSSKDKGFSVRQHPRNKKVYLTTGEHRFEYSPTAESFLPLESGNKQKSLRKTMGELHEGHFWKKLGPALIFLSGLLPLFFYISGIYLWIKKSKAKIV